MNKKTWDSIASKNNKSLFPTLDLCGARSSQIILSALEIKGQIKISFSPSRILWPHYKLNFPSLLKDKIFVNWTISEFWKLGSFQGNTGAFIVWFSENIWLNIFQCKLNYSRQLPWYKWLDIIYVSGKTLPVLECGDYQLMIIQHNTQRGYKFIRNFHDDLPHVSESRWVLLVAIESNNARIFEAFCPVIYSEWKISFKPIGLH